MLQDRHRMHVNVSIPEEPDLPVEDKQAVLRIIQEAMQNTIKHAQATEFEIQFVESDGFEYQLTLRDNGIGFDPTQDYPGHVGLKSMPERVERLGGRFSIESQPNAGTTIQVTIPRRATK
jgi:signal transduction histidine kinase